MAVVEGAGAERGGRAEREGAVVDCDDWAVDPRTPPLEERVVAFLAVVTGSVDTPRGALLPPGTK